MRIFFVEGLLVDNQSGMDFGFDPVQGSFGMLEFLLIAGVN